MKGRGLNLIKINFKYKNGIKCIIFINVIDMFIFILRVFKYYFVYVYMYLYFIIWNDKEIFLLYGGLEN